MKTKTILEKLWAGLRGPMVSGVVFVLLTPLSAAQAASAADLLEKGIYTEETKGELEAATEIYQQIVDDPEADRRFVAQAHVRLGLCQLKLGNKPQAIAALERLTQEFPDRDRLLAMIEPSMPQMLDEIIGQIEQNYMKEVDRSELMEAALHAIAGKMDQQGGFLRNDDLAFLGTEELKQLKDQMAQKFAGIGAALKAAASEVFVEAPLPGSPALRGGVRPGDRILSIDGTALTENQPLETAVKLIRGPIGTAVTLELMRPGSEDVHTLTLVRDSVRLASVFGHHRKPDHTWDFMLDAPSGIGYIRLDYLGKESPDELRTALEELQAAGMKRLVLDLRSNPGGLLDAAVAAADLFLEQGRILTVKSRKGETAYEAKAEGTFLGFPIAVIVNRKTASAAEIIAASLQDHQRANVIGERSLGQGIVRSIFHLQSGAGAVKLPVAAYYRPNGKNMNRYPFSKETDDWGVIPNTGCEVVLGEEEYAAYEQDRSRHGSLFGGSTPSAEFTDRQLNKALDVLR